MRFSAEQRGFTEGGVLAWGTDAQKRTVVESICAGNLKAIALSEPGAGSDLASARMPAVLDGDHFVLDGQKTWTTAAHLAAHILVLVRTDSSGGKHDGLLAGKRILITVVAPASGAASPGTSSASAAAKAQRA